MSIFPLFIGPPGCGKGTQAELLASHLLLPRVAAGDLLREAASGSGPFATKIRAMIDAGKIIEDSFVMHMIDRRLDEPDCARGAILDGCVRTLDQALVLDSLMASRGGLALIVSLQIPDDVAALRIASRWTHRVTGAPLPPERLPEMQTRQSKEYDNFYRRPEDQLPVIRKRQELYWKVTSQAVKHYQRYPSFIELDGSQQPDVLHQHVINSLRHRISQVSA